MIYAAMESRAKAGKPIDHLMLFEELMRSNQLQEAGGAVYTSSLTDGLPH